MFFLVVKKSIPIYEALRFICSTISPRGVCNYFGRARALCLPILSSDIPSAREQIQDGINGYVAELSAEDLADKIEYLYNNPSQRKKTVEYLKEHPIDFSTELLKLEII